MTLHDIVYGLVGLLLAYIGWLLVRFFVAGRRKPLAAETQDFPDAPSETIHSQILGGDSGKSFSSVFYDGASLLADSDERPEPRLSRSPEPDASQFGFDALLEMRQTRTLLDDLRTRHEALQAEVSALKESLAELRAASQVSPIYGEAVSLARRGYDVQVIAERCGISVAEAELVRSLSSETRDDGEADHA